MPALVDHGSRMGQPSRFVLLGLGKFGGQEMSYHSDLDLILVYEGDGRTVPPPGSSRWDTFELTDNFHFFSELARNIIRVTGQMGPRGRLYQIDMRLRPTGKSGSLVIPLCEFIRYYEEGGAQLWERQALTRARVVAGDPQFAQEVLSAIGRETYGVPWKPEMIDEIRSMRDRVQASGSKRDLKRGKGGIVDIEFVVQMVRLKYGKDHPEVRHPNTWNAIDGMKAVGLLSDDEYDTLRGGYTFLRQVESRLRIFHNRSLDELPEQPDELEKLARRLGLETKDSKTAVQRFREAMEQHTSGIRGLYLTLFDREREKDAAVA